MITQVITFMQEHYADPDLTISQLARWAFVSREHLSRVFKDYTGQTLHSYLTTLRMQHCRQAISSGTSILDASTESGFSNYSSFLKMFRKLYGITPAEYRSRLQQEISD